MDIRQEMQKLPIARRIEIVRQIFADDAFNGLTFSLLQDLEVTLAALHRDATDQAAAENDALHGPDVSQLTDTWVSPCGMRVGG